jgi:dTDP-4-dehydrorhamnose 3,5-epimerase-like enzyme
MKIDKNLKDTILIRTRSINDERGYLCPITDNIHPELLNRACLVGNSARGIKRGIHYHKKEWKIYSVLTGSAKFISFKIPKEYFDNIDLSGYPVDIAYKHWKEHIKLYGEKNPDALQTFVISSRSPAVLVIPAEHANGWVSLEDNTNIIFLSNLLYEDAKKDDYRFDASVVSENYWNIE